MEGVQIVKSERPDESILWIPFFASALSATVLAIRVLPACWNVFKSRSTPLDRLYGLRECEDATEPLLSDDANITRARHAGREDYVKSQGGRVILAFRLVRLFGLLILLGLSLASPSATRDVVDHRSAITLVYCYVALLSFSTFLRQNHRERRELDLHVDLVLLTVFGIYAYRDIWPFATYDQQPLDLDEGPILWAKLALLTIVSVFVPLFVPRQYVPIDSEDPMDVPHPEQTASIFSMAIYTYLDPIIYEAYKVPHLSHTRLPPLPDYDHAERLIEKAFPHLDPFHGAKKQHLFFGILRVFAKEWLQLGIIIMLLAMSNYIPSIALNKVLASLESNPNAKGSNIRPWFWVLCLFLGPLCVALSLQRYAFVATTLVARTQAIMTQLIYEHSLRVRVVAEKSGSNRQQGTGKAEASEKENNLIGKINTLVAVDVGNLGGGKDFLMVVLQGPIELTIATAILWNLLGWSAVVGLGSIILLLPLPGYIGGKMQTIHRNRMRKTDARVQSVVETLNVIRMIKMFGWEEKMRERLDEKREEELAWLWKDKMINLVNELINFVIPTITMLVTYATYTLIMKESLNASKVFASAAVFTSVRGLMRRTSTLFGLAVKAKVSLDRINRFLLETELLDGFTTCADQKTQQYALGPLDMDNIEAIGFQNAEFTWSRAENDRGEDSTSPFRLKIPGILTFKRGGINLIYGPTYDVHFCNGSKLTACWRNSGSGKTSILMALLGEMHFIPIGTDSWYNLPREGGIAYAAQESWVLNDTIKNNILFGSPYQEAKYNKVISQCALSRDLELFDAGDETEVGERGITLSGGQRARVTLARAIYSSAEILLLDDVFASLDAHTARWIAKECFQGDLVRNRTIILVSHNIALAGSIADFVVSVGSDGIARSLQGALASDYVLTDELSEQTLVGRDQQDDINHSYFDQDPGHLKADGKLIAKEEVALGRVSTRAYKLFLKGLGGDHYIIFLTFWILGLLIMHGGSMLSVWFLGHWGSQYQLHEPVNVNVSYYLFVYSAILLVSMATFSLAVIIYNHGTQRASKTINDQLITSILLSTLQWLDRTPVARVISRCSQDIASIDDRLPDNLSKVADMSLSMLVRFTGPLLFTPIFVLPGGVVAILGIYMCNAYLRAQMSMKRETSNARSPILAHFGETLNGLVSIRSYNAQARFKSKSLAYIDHYTKVLRATNDINRWIGIRIDLLGASFAGSLGWYLVSRQRLNAADTGFSLTMALEFCTIILWLLRNWNLLEIESNSLERIQAYLEIEHEPEPTEAGKPPASWPSSGELCVKDLSAWYSQTGPAVLRNISFHVRSGERVGIVGRTGSGKSSLTLSLLRLIFTSGVVLYDGISTDAINLSHLRANITIIPQVPELLSGTLRRNVDPFGQYDDVYLNEILQSVGFFTLRGLPEQNHLPYKMWTLDSEISSAGVNLSTGQRQIIALARALVRRSHILILDEATSAIDFETDSSIQSALKTRSRQGVTTLIVAHRLRTVMDADKIMVLDEGRIVEFGTPWDLLQKQGGYFKSLVDESRDVAALHTLVHRG